MNEPGVPSVARARAAAGALFFDEDGRVMIVQPSYKTQRDIPGGIVEPGETPYQACVREVGEELGIQPPIGRLLVVDWAPSPKYGDLILFVFDGGVLGADVLERIVFSDNELTSFGFHPVEDMDDLLTERLALRVKTAVAARELGGSVYLEYGRAVPG
ncbi:NUDIX domain-containing protein [Streptosporangium sp. NPDC087985]|uniref:NUDIX domain-containing protein n=1 Tax=Streptosporangium sp. NPDC087985 TaxID=3366196 RepID=UPI00381AF084